MPGGKVDWLEPVVAAVAREIAEELCLALRRSASLCVVDQIDGEHEEHRLAPICLVEDAVGEPRVLDPAALAGCGWFPLDELPAPLTRATQVAVALLASTLIQCLADKAGVIGRIPLRQRSLAKTPKGWA